MIPSKAWLSTFGHWLTAIGLVTLAVYCGLWLDGAASSHRALREFDREVAERSGVQQHGNFRGEFRLNRILDLSLSATLSQDSALAVLGIERVNLRVPVFRGTGSQTLNRGAGWIEGTARPGELGNVGIAGHRDSFFRDLKDVGMGDRIQLITRGHTIAYRVDEIEIVDPSDVGVLQPRATPSLTLVTCYPFYYVGAAPQRYIVHASLSEPVLIQEVSKQKVRTDLGQRTRIGAREELKHDN
jgi:sortase A